MRGIAFLFVAFSVIAGCGSPPTTPPGDGSVPTDGTGPGGCTGMPDGTACGSDLICVDGDCVASECGDGFLDEEGGEVCDDGNMEAFDGCEPSTCVFTCTAATDCDDGQVCNGAETCSGEHVCAFGTAATNGTSCSLAGGADGVCRTGECVAAGCGNGVTDAGEDCDDMNAVEGDGCDVDCTFSCMEDLDCSDGDVCNGSETCDVPNHACVAGTAEDCDDTSACTMDTCDPIDGCANPLIDADGDMHAAESLGACGDDCDDTRADVYTGAEELCDAVDNNCNGDTDEVAPTWYIDCDDDGFAATTDGSRTGCTEPPASATGCGGGWTTVRPVGVGSTDCRDTNDDVFPGQTAWFSVPIPGVSSTTTRYDYDCSGAHSRRYTCAPSTGGCGPSCGGGYQPRNTTDNTNGCTFLCIGGGSCFVSDYPDCGESAMYSACIPILGGGCLASSRASRAQQCH